MTLHYHLLVETQNANLAKGMRQLNGVYTMQDIGDYFGLHYSRISKIVQAAGQAKRAKGRT